MPVNIEEIVFQCVSYCSDEIDLTQYKQLKKISLEAKIDNLLKNLPKNIEEIVLYREFDDEINLTHYKQLKKISFGIKFNKSIEQLPENIEEIIFFITSDFNQEVNLAKYKNLKKISFEDLTFRCKD